MHLGFSINCKGHCNLLLSTAFRPETYFILLSIRLISMKSCEKLFSRFRFLANVIVSLKKITALGRVVQQSKHDFSLFI